MVKVMSPSKLEIRPFTTAVSFVIYNVSWQVTTDCYTRAQNLNLMGLDFLYLAWFLCHVTLKLAETLVVKSRPSVPYSDHVKVCYVCQCSKICFSHFLLLESNIMFNPYYMQSI